MGERTLDFRLGTAVLTAMAGEPAENDEGLVM